MKRLFACAAVLVMSARVASAQDRPPIELGVGISAFGAGTQYEGAPVPRGDGGSPDVRVTFPLSKRFSIEEMVTFTSRDNHYETYRDRRDGLIFATQVKQRIDKWTHGGFQPFLLYGAAVYSERQRVDYGPIRLPSGVVMTFPTSTHTEQWTYGVFGAGVQQQIGRHVAVRAEVTALTFLSGNTRASVGVSIPIGSYK